MLIVKTLFDVIVNCFSNSVEQIPTKFKQVSGEVKFHWSERRGGAQEAGGEFRPGAEGSLFFWICSPVTLNCPALKNLQTLILGMVIR